ncbi:ATP-binding cassette domain-containing protein [Corynebacterium sp. zg254]|uniref:ABC transporter ATP-binding protein n=1 Tax=Corynebacterium zhongnanshanii TaxID=2768834 RepID=A0ABQ6VK17_9CORY|nr:ABC transporter ATP-binding protein [Corynebacterium zhongnanshanii]MCR5914105.1 ATP-binding cassette domain-containing protein [Corynebacterium sp. zg254]
MANHIPERSPAQPSRSSHSSPPHVAVPQQPRIHPTSLSFSYRHPGGAGVVAAEDLSITGEPTLLLGANGAGKTTLMRILAGQLRVRGLDRSGLPAVSYVPQFFTPIRGFTVREHVSYVAWLDGQKRATATKNADQWLDFVGLGDLANRSCAQLSGGQQAKVQLATALNSGAQLLLLDEPSASLDPLAKRELQDLYNSIVAAHTGVWVSTHQPHEVADPFTRVIVLHEGTVRYDGTIDGFRALGNGATADGDPAVVALAQATVR